MSDQQRFYFRQLLEMSCSIAKGGHLFVEFVDIIPSEKLYVKDFFPSSSNGNKSASRVFIDFGANEIFNKEIKKKIRRCNFISCAIVQLIQQSLRNRVYMGQSIQEWTN